MVPQSNGSWFRSCGQGFLPLPLALAAAEYLAASQGPEAPAPPFQIRGAGGGGGRGRPLLASSRCPIFHSGGLEQGRILPRKSLLPASPSPREGGGEEEWSGPCGGICLDLTTLSTRAQTQGNLEKALSSPRLGVRGRSGGFHSPGEEGGGGEGRGCQLMQPHSWVTRSTPSPRARGGAPTLLRPARSSDAARGSR